MSAATRKLGCVGLSPREATQARLLLDVLQDRLEGRWTLVESVDADVVLADPRDREGRSVIAAGDTAARVIAVTDRGVDAPDRAGAHLWRPFRSDNLVRAINRIDGVGTEPDRARDETRETSLPHAIHEAMRGGAGAGPVVISGLPGGDLLLDGPADTVRGPLRALTAERLVAGERCSVRPVPAEAAGGIAAGQPRHGAYDLLWSLGEQAAESGMPIGDERDARLRLARWPRQSRLASARSRIRAASLLRQRGMTLEQVAAASRTSRAGLAPMLGAAWLVGDLEVDEQAGTQAARSGANRRNRQRERPSASLIGRIRNRLGAA